MLLVTSRTPETWLGEARRIQVSGLRHHEAIEYADQLLAPFPAAAPRRAKRAFGELLEWLDGHPLSMRLTLPHLEAMDADAVLAGLRGAASLPETGGRERTTSLPASVAYSMAHLNAMDRASLVAVSLLQGVASAEMLSALSAHDRVPHRFSRIDLARWVEVLDRAAHFGLLTELGAGLYVIHPALPSYLAEQWRAGDPDGSERAAAERLLIDVCASYGLWLSQQIYEGDAANAYQLIGWQRRTLGHLLARALSDCLWERAYDIAVPLNEYWNRNGLAVEADAWVDRVVLTLEGSDGTPPPPDGPAGGLWRFFLGAKASRLNLVGQHNAADAIYAQINDIVRAQRYSPGQRGTLAIGYHQRGIAALKRGDLDEAERWHRQSLTVWEENGDRYMMAGDYHQLGRVEQERGNLDEAEQWHRQALGINKEFGNQSGIAASSQELGFVAQERQDWDQAEQWYHRSLAIKERLGDRPAATTSYTELGVLAQRRGRLDEAEQWHHKALIIQEELDDRPGKATTYHLLGTLAQARGRLDEAEQWYSQSGAILEELGDRARLATSYDQRGALALQRGQPAEALDWLVRSVTLFDEFPHPATATVLPLLARLIKLLGTEALHECWKRVTGNVLPARVREFAEAVKKLDE
jgi:tetratricopeptide (TPR) repeat protein